MPGVPIAEDKCTDLPFRARKESRMAKSSAFRGLLASCVLLAGSALASAQPGAPTVAQMLDNRFAPKQKDVQVSTPTGAELKGCTVGAIAGTRPGSTGWELLDAKKQPIRRYFGGKGAKGGVDTWCYFKDGVEVYREIDSNNDGIPDQFRWLNSAGLKWGMDVNGDGKIDSWRIISAEEVGHEAFLALATNDLARLQALFITPNELQMLKLPAKEVERLTNQQKQAAKKFADLLKAQPQLAGGQFERVESAVPSCVPGESIGGESDLIKFPSRAILYEGTNKKHEWIHTGELIQVGFAWRLIDVPTIEEPTSTPGGAAPMPTTNPQMKEVLSRLEELDRKYDGVLPSDPKLKEYFEARIALVQQALPLVDGKDREGWYKQIFDNLSTLAQSGDAGALKNLSGLCAQVAKNMPGSNLAAYGAYREMWTHYTQAIDPAKNPKQTSADVEKLQKAWLEQLTKFVQAYPSAEDTTPDALFQLAMHTEFMGKDEEAKKWYEAVYSKFPEHYLAEKCKGSVKRLDLPGKKMELIAPQLQSGAPFDVASIKDKLVVVYYWASYCSQCVGDFARLNKLVDSHPGKLELVCVDLDDTPEAAALFLKSTPIKGTHLYQPAPKNTGGMSSPLALQYGINGLPTVFLIGRDGRVMTRALQISDLENELKKAK
jgi:thiol-disulfide isomerase/thioredoxin